MDWRLGLFRFGLVACIAGAIFIVSQFSIVESSVAIWNNNPTTEEAISATTAAVERKAACLSAEAKTSTIEYPSHCYSGDPAFHGMTREKAVKNIEGFAFASLALLIGIFSVVSLGVRMARESRA